MQSNKLYKNFSQIKCKDFCSEKMECAAYVHFKNDENKHWVRTTLSYSVQSFSKTQLYYKSSNIYNFRFYFSLCINKSALSIRLRKI